MKHLASILNICMQIYIYRHLCYLYVYLNTHTGWVGRGQPHKRESGEQREDKAMWDLNPTAMSTEKQLVLKLMRRHVIDVL